MRIIIFYLLMISCQHSKFSDKEYVDLGMKVIELQNKIMSLEVELQRMSEEDCEFD